MDLQALFLISLFAELIANDRRSSSARRQIVFPGF